MIKQDFIDFDLVCIGRLVFFQASIDFALYHLFGLDPLPKNVDFFIFSYLMIKIKEKVPFHWDGTQRFLHFLLDFVHQLEVQVLLLIEFEGFMASWGQRALVLASTFSVWLVISSCFYNVIIVMKDLKVEVVLTFTIIVSAYHFFLLFPLELKNRHSF